MPARVSSPLRRYRSGRGLLGFALLSVAIVIAAFLVTRAGARSEKAEIITSTPIVGQFDTVQVPVPVEPVTAGTLLKDVRFQKVSFPVHQVPKGAILEIEPHLNSMAVAPLPASIPIFIKNLSQNTSASNPVIDKIPEGMRAITVRVDATASVEGWASSGAVVDVLLVGNEGTHVVAEKVKILSAERSVNPIQNMANPSVPSTVTLLVSQEQAMAVTTAIPMGKIAFALRSIGDEGSWSDRRYSKDRLKGKPAGEDSNSIKGYVRIEGKSPKSFALSGNSWIPTDVQPKRLITEDE